MPPKRHATRKENSPKAERRGLAIIYVAVTMSAMLGFCSLAVDFGRVQVAKTELRRAVDSSARYAALGVTKSLGYSWASLVAAQNNVDGTPLVLANSDVLTGKWNTTTRSFTQTGSSPTAVQISAQRTIPCLFASIIGRSSVVVHASATAMVTVGTNTVINVPGGADPWLAGMPNGTTANYTNQGWTDSAPTNSPVQASGLTLTTGNALQFKFSGAVSYFPGTQPFDPDGDPSDIIYDYIANGGSEHGIADLKAPITSVIGVFLNDSQPDSGTAPQMLDFTTAESRDFESLSPLLKQPFYIGNGVRADGVTLQNFIVPPGATRLFIGVMDGQQWSDNSGSLSTTVNRPTQISVVK